MNKRKRKTGDIIVSMTAIILGLIIIFPVLYIVMGAFKAPDEFIGNSCHMFPQSFLYMDNFKEVMDKAPIFRFALNSFIMAFLGTTLNIIFAILASYAFAEFNFYGKRIFFFIILGTLLIPSDTLFITNYLTVAKLNLLDSYFGLVINSLVSGATVFMLYQHFKHLPREYKDAASVDGCGDLRYLWHIVLPNSKGIITIFYIRTFISFWNSYIWPLLITNNENMRTIQVGITMLSSELGTNYTLISAGVTLLLIPAFVLFVILQRNTKGEDLSMTITG